jgi:hypothetical protein
MRVLMLLLLLLLLPARTLQLLRCGLALGLALALDPLELPALPLGLRRGLGLGTEAARAELGLETRCCKQFLVPHRGGHGDNLDLSAAATGRGRGEVVRAAGGFDKIAMKKGGLSMVNFSSTKKNKKK